jgi:hypothetical protein
VRHDLPLLPERSRFYNSPFFLTVSFALIAALVTAIKLLRLSSRELWMDEAYSALLSSMSWKQMFNTICGDVHPPLYYFLLWGWVRAAGNSEQALRLFSVLISAVALTAFFFVARKWMDARYAAFAGMLFALSPVLYNYSLEVRMYMLGVTLSIVLLGLHRKVTAEGEAGWQPVLLYGIFGALLYYTHYIGIFILIALFLDWGIAARLRPGALRRLGVAALIVAALTAPWYPVMMQQRHAKLAQIQKMNALEAAPTSLSFGKAVQQPPSTSNQVVSILYESGAAAGMYPATSLWLKIVFRFPLAILLAGVLYHAARGDSICRLFVLMSFALACGLFFLLRLFQLRYLLEVLPFLFLAIARTIEIGWKPKWKPFAAAIALFTLIAYSAGFYKEAKIIHDRPLSRLVALLKERYRRNDVLVFYPAQEQVNFDYYAQQARFHPQESGFPDTIYSWWEHESSKGWAVRVGNRAELESAAAGLEKCPQPRTVWLLLKRENIFDPQGLFVKRMSEMGDAMEISYQNRSERNSRDILDGNPRFRLVAISEKGQR